MDMRYKYTGWLHLEALVRAAERGRWEGVPGSPEHGPASGLAFLLSELWALGLLQVPMHGNPGAPHSLAYLMSTLVLAKMEHPGFQLQLGGRLLLLGDGLQQHGDPVLQLVDLLVPGWGTGRAPLSAALGTSPL